MDDAGPNQGPQYSLVQSRRGEELVRALISPSGCSEPCLWAARGILLRFLKRPPSSQASFALLALRKGDEFLKYCRHSKPHICHISLCGDDQTELQWVSKNGTLRRVRISQIKDVSEGRGSAVFKRFPRLHAEELSFSVSFAEDSQSLRTLDLVCKARRVDIGQDVCAWYSCSRPPSVAQDVRQQRVWIDGLKFLCERTPVAGRPSSGPRLQHKQALAPLANGETEQARQGCSFVPHTAHTHGVLSSQRAKERPVQFCFLDASFGGQPSARQGTEFWALRGSSL